MCKHTALSLLLAATVLAAPAMAIADSGVHVSFVDDAGQPASQLYVSGHKVRVESEDPQQGSIIYDAGKHTLTVLMPARHAYMVLDQQSAAEMGAVMQDAQKQMQAQMANLPPEQRAMVEQMLAKNGMGGGQSKVSIRELGSSETVAGIRCRDIELIRGSQAARKLCVAPLASLGIPAGAIATLNAMRTDMKRLMAHLGPMAQAYSALQDVEGFAIKREVPHREGFKLVMRTEQLKAVQRGSPPARLFEIPAGYQKTSMKDMMRAGPPQH